MEDTLRRQRDAAVQGLGMAEAQRRIWWLHAADIALPPIRCASAPTGAVSSFVRARSLTASMLGQRSTRLTFCFGSSAGLRLHCMRLVEQLYFPGGDSA